MALVSAQVQELQQERWVPLSELGPEFRKNSLQSAGAPTFQFFPEAEPKRQPVEARLPPLVAVVEQALAVDLFR
jgi:hypothetical protein